MSLRIFVALCSFVILFTADVPAFGQGRTIPIQQTIKNVVHPWIEKFEPPGSIVIVHHQGKTEFFPHGEANRERHIAVTADSIFELASITKVFTTTSLAMEIEEKRMQLKDPVDQYLPILRSGGDIRKVTLEQLATHTSSLPRGPGAHPSGTWDQKQVMEWLVHWRAAYPPGTKSLYSNLAVGVLGDAIAAKEQKPLQEVWERQFLHPLEMKSTFFEIPEDATGRLVQGYDAKGRRATRAPYLGGWPAGGRLCSSGQDMAKFLAANLGESPHHPLITKSMHLAQQPYFKASAKMTQGLSWQRVHLDNELVIDKNGGLAGTSTYIGMIPAKRLGVVVMANRGKAQATAVGRQLLMTLAGSSHKADSCGMEEEDDE